MIVYFDRCLEWIRLRLESTASILFIQLASVAQIITRGVRIAFRVTQPESKIVRFTAAHSGRWTVSVKIKPRAGVEWSYGPRVSILLFKAESRPCITHRLNRVVHFLFLLCSWYGRKTAREYAHLLYDARMKPLFNVFSFFHLEHFSFSRLLLRRLPLREQCEVGDLVRSHIGICGAFMAIYSAHIGWELCRNLILGLNFL